jgi:alanine dehydrogenase
MIVGVPKEIKDNEYRVSMVPAGVKVLVDAGHEVLFEKGAGIGSGLTDDAYGRAGAALIEGPDEVFGRADMIVKVKEPQPAECRRLRRSQILFTYLHLAPLPELTRELLEREVTGIAYETIEEQDGALPLLTPMSEVAGRMSIQVGASCLEKSHGGSGILLGGVPGVARAEVVIIGGGIVGLNAAKIAVGLGANVTILDRSIPRLRYLDDIFAGGVTTLCSGPYTIEESVLKADLLVGAVLVVGAAAPRLVTRRMVGGMKPGSVIVDVSVDQGGCIETTRVTTHSAPTYTVDGVVHYGVANMPGAVPRTSTFALTNVTLPFVARIASLGFEEAARRDPVLRVGLNTYRGQIAHPAVASSQGREAVPVERILPGA